MGDAHARGEAAPGPIYTWVLGPYLRLAPRYISTLAAPNSACVADACLRRERYISKAYNKSLKVEVLGEIIVAAACGSCAPPGHPWPAPQPRAHPRARLLQVARYSVSGRRKEGRRTTLERERSPELQRLIPLASQGRQRGLASGRQLAQRRWRRRARQARHLARPNGAVRCPALLLLVGRRSVRVARPPRQVASVRALPVAVVVI